MAFGVVSSFVTVLLAIFPTHLNGYVGKCPWLYLIIFGLISVSFGWFSIRKKKSIKLSLSERVKASVYYGDIFNNNGIIIIPVNEYFDTLVDDRVIAENTLHGMFIKQFFGGNEKALRNQIIHSLNNKPFIEINPNRTIGNKKRYELGTVAEVVKDSKIFF